MGTQILQFGVGCVVSPALSEVGCLKILGFFHKKNTFIWNPNGAPCFDWKRPCFGGVDLQKIEVIKGFQVFGGTNF